MREASEPRRVAVFHLPDPLATALEAAAKAAYTSRSEYLRQALLAKLAADSVKPERVAA